jgi:predicted metalloprotease with PDZ domain
MSFKNHFRRRASLKFLVVSIGFFLLSASNASGQDIEAKIKVISSSRVQVEGKFTDPKYAGEKDWTFLQSYADVSDLGKRIDKLTLFDDDDKEIALKKYIPGIYTAESGAAKWRYEIDLKPNAPTAAAHVSWLNTEGGLLMPEDLLPRLNTADGEKVSARITLELPEEWKISTLEDRAGDNEYEIKDISKSVFAVGKNWRERSVQQGSVELKLVTAGEWQFADEQALGMAQTILEEHRRIFGEMPFPEMQVILSPFPKPAEPGIWRAETRGASVVLISSQMPFKSQAVNRLHEQLRHELFHLWIPGRLALSGNYDWFFEGFTLYHALKTGKRLNQIRFFDLLDTLGRVYTLNEEVNRGLSLIEASERRWDGNFDFVNSRGMIAAFLCDLALLRESKGKRSLTEIFRELYRKHAIPGPVQDGNKAILAILKNHPELRGIAAQYIEGREKIELGPALADFGLETQLRAGNTTLKIKSKLTGRQKDLLVRLGLNPLYELPEKAK